MKAQDTQPLMTDRNAIPEQVNPANKIDMEKNEMTEEFNNEISETRTFTSALTEDKFEMNPRGVFWVYQKKTGGEWEEALEPICGPLRVLGTARDSENRNWSMLVAAKDPEGVEHLLTIRRDQLDGETLTQMLRSAGVTVVASAKAKEKLVTFLQDCPPEQEEHMRMTDRSGWHKKAYILPDGTTHGQSDESYILTSTKPKDRKVFTPAGDHKEWIKNVSYLCNGNSRLLFAVSVAFSAPLLTLLKMEGGGFNLVGDSSLGKSTAMVVAASVFGNPDGYVEGWRATSNGLEHMAQRHNDMLLVLDEMGEMSAQEIGAVAYMLANGQGKQRMSSGATMRDRLEWTTTILSSGERTLADHMAEGGKKTKAGQEVRLADIPADAGEGHGLFEYLHDHAGGAELSITLKNNAKQHYGTALPLYLDGVANQFEKFLSGYAQIKQRFLEEIMPAGASSQVRRLTEKMALIGAAGEFATHLGVTGWKENDAIWAAQKCLLAWINLRGGTDRQETNQIISQARGFFERHGDARFVEMVYNGSQYRVDNTRKVQNRAGYKRIKGDQVEFLVMPSVFREEICNGLNQTSAAKVLIEKGYLLPAGDGKSTSSHRIPEGGNKKLYHFSNAILSDE